MHAEPPPPSVLAGPLHEDRGPRPQLRSRPRGPSPRSKTAVY
jgi:hypothetical protein